MTLKKARTVAISFLLLALSGCATPYVRSELYFGSARQGKKDISKEDWENFVDEVITPRFPNGLTVVEGHGQWQMHDGSLARETSRIVIVVHPGTADEQKKLDDIRDTYKARFNQEAVLEIDGDAKIKF